MSATVFPVPGSVAGSRRDPGDMPARPLLQGAPRLGAAEALLSRKLGLGLYCAIDDGAASLTLRPAGGDGAVRPARPLWLSGPAGPLEVDDGARLLRVLTGIDLDSVELEDGAYPDWLVAAVLGRLQATPLRVVRDIAPAGAFSAAPQALRLRLSQRNHALDLSLRAAGVAWLALLDQPDWTPLRSPLAACLDWPATATVVLARHRLPLAALRRIEAGDIILPARAAFATDGAGTLRLAGRSWRVRYQAPDSLQLIATEDRLEFEQTYEAGDGEAEEAGEFPQLSHGDDSEHEHEPEHEAEREFAAAPAPQDGDGNALDQLPLTLVFELGRVNLSLGQIRTLGPQTVLTLEGGNPAAIGIFCGGRDIGGGEVVDVDGALGIRITRWSGAC